jgi:hypothetical protein
MQLSGGQYSQKMFSLSLVALYHHTTTNTALFLAERAFKLVIAASLSSRRRTTAFWGNLHPL